MGADIPEDRAALPDGTWHVQPADAWVSEPFDAAAWEWRMNDPDTPKAVWDGQRLVECDVNKTIAAILQVPDAR